MAVDRAVDGYPQDVSSSVGELRHDYDRNPAQESTARREPADLRARTAYYWAFRVAFAEHERALKAASTSADSSRQSAWDNADEHTRPPLDAFRAPPERIVHILDGDATGGGHRHGTGTPGKTEFPATWSDEKIIDNILSIAHSPDSARLQRNGRWIAEGVRDEVRLAVIIMADGRIWTAYPLPGSPGVRQNPRNQ